MYNICYITIVAYRPGYVNNKNFSYIFLPWQKKKIFLLSQLYGQEK
ncbi:hypothetical protein HMPREF1548_01730 [Clostridium sp. KLE 1755]|nr:hypothetical protein HMPREF1548_01730 [Clostridium sp. KLE 1755]